MSYRVSVKPSGREFTVEEEESIIDAALRQGLALPYGCRSGFCGDCKGKVLSGAVRYPDGVPDALSEDEQAQGLALFCQARAAGDLVLEAHELNTAAEIPVRNLPCKVARMERLAPDVMRLFLKLPEGERLQFLAGQYVDFLLKDGRHRAFSMANAPHDDEFIELHIRHVEGGEFTDFVFNALQEKTLLRIEGPHGSFCLREASERPIIFMAGGTGFAPIKAIIEHALAEGLRRQMHLYWGARARADLYLHELAMRWALEVPEFRYTPVLSEPQAQDHWQGRTGFVHATIAQDYPSLADHDVYAAGPPIMVDAGGQAFLAQGLPADHYFSDAFTLAKDSKK
jgi:CDP-4-dehydro-6-deoxyglucose reductase